MKIDYRDSQEDNRKAYNRTFFENFTGVNFTRLYKVERQFVPFKRFNIWYEMVFDECLN